VQLGPLAAGCDPAAVRLLELAALAAASSASLGRRSSVAGDALSADDAGAGPGRQKGLEVAQDRVEAQAGAAVADPRIDLRKRPHASPCRPAAPPKRRLVIRRRGPYVATRPFLARVERGGDLLYVISASGRHYAALRIAEGLVGPYTHFALDLPTKDQ
jgi:hypothetical protein